ncbi:hypothetical protein DM02DRAFT_80738 [Periconia macrospinosa]|uniref:Uncharacterized protein n=1 Tax=Periconia macrospinosa TaxID=97972 RepID=A0A2V1DHK4_9PLEO|nr:hypothetical protein DM02DRAFT_80738 [Periconia macrospinosa]
MKARGALLFTDWFVVTATCITSIPHPYVKLVALCRPISLIFPSLMPPLPLSPVSADQPRTTGLLAAQVQSGEYGRLFKIFLLVLVVVTGLRLFLTRLSTRETRRRNQTTTPPSQTINSTWKQNLRHDRPSISKDPQQATIPYEGIYPWIAPPQPLPGPYDPPFYPLPTLRRHSYDPSVTMDTNTKARIASYSRRVSAANIHKSETTQRATIHGKVTTSTKGWRRNQWVISGE